MDPKDEDLITVGEAMVYLDVGNKRVAEYIKMGELTVFQKERNRRKKWLLKSEVEALRKRLNIAKKLVPAA